MVGVTEGLLLLEEHCLAFAADSPQGVSVLFCLDGQSALESLGLGPWRQRCPMGQRIWALIATLCSRGFRLCFAFAFGHCGWPPGDHVDALAKSALTMSPEVHDRVPIWAGDEARLLAAPHVAQATAELKASMGFRSSLLGESVFMGSLRGLSRGEARLVAQLRTGCCGRLGGWRHEAPEACPLCAADGALCRDGGAVKHLLSCPALQLLRQQCFATASVTAKAVLTDRPNLIARYAAKALQLMGR